MFAWTEHDRGRVRDLRNARSPESADLAAEEVFCFEMACKVPPLLCVWCCSAMPPCAGRAPDGPEARLLPVGRA